MYCNFPHLLSIKLNMKHRFSIVIPKCIIVTSENDIYNLGVISLGCNEKSFGNINTIILFLNTFTVPVYIVMDQMLFFNDTDINLAK